MREGPAADVVAGLVSSVAVVAVAAAMTDGAHVGDAGPLGRLAGSLRDRVLDVVGPDEIVERLDINAVLARVDIAAVLERVDVDALIARVDVNAVLDRVDVNAVMERVDVERVVQRAGIPAIVAESTGSVAGSTLDLARRQLLGLDVVLARAVMRVRSRDEHSLPAGPAALVGDPGRTPSIPVPSAPTTDVSGHYAGLITRLAAFVLDVALAGGSFTIASGALGSSLRIAGAPVDDITGGGVVFAAASVLWVFSYWWASTAVAGRTPGMALVGLRVVTLVGLPVSGGRALVRVLTMPLSLLLFGLGLLGIVFDDQRRALHDVIAGTTVVYDWGERTATMPTPLARWLAKRAAPIDAPAPPMRARP